MIESSRYNRENYPRKCFLTQERETRVKFNPGLSANRPSNIWAQQFCKASCMCLLPVLPKLKYTLFLLFLLQRNSNFSVGLDTKWPKGIWTCWTHWYKKFRSFTTRGRSDSTTSQLNMTRNKDYKPKRKTRNFTLDWMYCWYCVLRESHYISYAL